MLLNVAAHNVSKRNINVLRFGTLTFTQHPLNFYISGGGGNRYSQHVHTPHCWQWKWLHWLHPAWPLAILLLVEMVAPCIACCWWVQMVTPCMAITAEGGNGYTLHGHAAGSGNGYILIKDTGSQRLPYQFSGTFCRRFFIIYTGSQKLPCINNMWSRLLPA
jgi:hypothetical protein